MTQPRAGFWLVVSVILLLIALQAVCGEQVTNVFSNVVAPGDATPSP